MKRLFKTRQEFELLLDKSNVVVEHVLVALFNAQTPREQSSEFTEEDNGVGFTGFDAEVLTNLAKQILQAIREGVPAGKRLRTGQYMFCRARHGTRRQHLLGKYFRQISTLQDRNLNQRRAA